MSRRKDRERVESLKASNPDYLGFRGYDREPGRGGPAPMQSVTCSLCGRKRNVAPSVVEAEGDQYVCLSCQEEQQGVEPEENGATEEPNSG